ncbi:hypothetical protein [Roseobacter sp. GAI101]|uniref:hypothetical protein n=1 Tax=Roseobacter sp. (strain GAI101) TaxID=391589 RepID=UPI0001871D85|nr:hypothetical protein [Roseobacter sp. GAI101]EEB85377.1 conserved hypothetical protein [Roseobacter sp. GAI101]
MTDKTAFTRFQTIAAQEIARLNLGGRITPFPGTQWVASSLLQKAIRRNLPHVAGQAGRFLLEVKREHLLRRLNAIASEDIGLADIETVAITAACLKSAKVRRDLGGEVIVTDYLIRRMCAARKSRSADDLLMTVERLPRLAPDRINFAQYSDARLRQIILGCPSLDQRALALWYLFGTKRCASDHLLFRKGNPDMAWDTLAELGIAPTMLLIARENFTKTVTMLAPYMSLLSLQNDVVSDRVKDDPTPVEIAINCNPSWGFDMYTRPGRAALHRLLLRNAGLAAWAADFLPKHGRVQILGELLFRIEGQCLSRRADGAFGTELRERWEQECAGVSPEAVEHGLAVLRNVLPDLNAIRADIAAEGLI